MSYDAIIIGAGHNGFVTGIYLAKAGWKVLILERNKEAGGAVRTAEVTLPGFKHDLFAKNLNLFAHSPFYKEFKDELHKHGLAFAYSSQAFSSVYPDGDYLGVTTDLNGTLEGIRKVSTHDADNWENLVESSVPRHIYSRFLAWQCPRGGFFMAYIEAFAPSDGIGFCRLPN